jgi:hypothetical protein
MAALEARCGAMLEEHKGVPSVRGQLHQGCQSCCLGSLLARLIHRIPACAFILADSVQSTIGDDSLGWRRDQNMESRSEFARPATRYQIRPL